MKKKIEEYSKFCDIIILFKGRDVRTVMEISPTMGESKLVGASATIKF